MPLRWALACLGFVLVAACDAIPSQSVDARSQNPDAGAASSSRTPAAFSLAERAAVALLRAPGDSPYCSGVLVAPNVVLTAGHCSSGAQIFVFFGEDASKPGQLRTLRAALPHPDFRWHPLEADVAVLILAEPAPLDVDPIPLGRVPASLGETLRLVGFGYSQKGRQGTYGRRTSHEVAMTQLGPTYFSYGVGSCEGDSGGPAFFERNGRVELVGITSTGDPSCSDHGTDTRIDVYANWIDAAIVAAAQ